MTTDKEDITARLREASTHALMDASRELVCEAAAEIERLREAIRRLADQDATLSVVGGNVTVEMDGCPYVTGTTTQYCTLTPFTLTDAERELIGDCAAICEAQAASAEEGMSHEAAERWAAKAATLRGLLERTLPTHATPGEGTIPGRDTLADEPPCSTERDN